MSLAACMRNRRVRLMPVVRHLEPGAFLGSTRRLGHQWSCGAERHAPPESPNCLRVEAHPFIS